MRSQFLAGLAVVALIAIGCDDGEQSPISSDAEVDIGTPDNVDASDGDDARVDNDATPRQDATVGDDAIVGDDAVVGNDATVGDDAVIGNDAVIGDDATIGDDAGQDAEPGADAVPDAGSGCAPGTTSACGDGIGACGGGERTCDGDGMWGPCEGEGEPTDELCNGIDDNCNGETDEGAPGSGEDCDTGDPGVCADGTTACVDGEIRCARDEDASAEICDGVDNDCDGQIDQANPGGGLPCDTGIPGICADGRTRCEAAELLCIEVSLPGDEFCDGIDNDCDGEVDEGDPGAGIPCPTDELGVCGDGETTCIDGQVSCTRSEEPTDEICDGLDNDCDGEVDEGDTLGGVECDTELEGVCAAGLTVCDGGVARCEPQQQPMDEVCNGLDDNCDGVTDEGAPGVGDNCETGEPGLCNPGTTQCNANGELVCVRNNEPGEEFCDEVDNDCDGEIDEAVEICDGRDNDCDGEIDESDPDLAQVCDTGRDGLCARGRIACIEAVLVCAANNMAMPEICDTLDNDCDGNSDESPIKPSGDVRLAEAAGDVRSPDLASTGAGYGVVWAEAREGPLTQLFYTFIDNDGVKQIGDIQLTDEAGAPPGRQSPDIVWNGTEFGITWVDNRNNLFPDLYFVLLDADGEVLPRVDPDAPNGEIAEELRVTPESTNAGGPSLVWNGSGWAAAFSDARNRTPLEENDEIYFSRISGEGESLDPENIRITTDPLDFPARDFTPSLAWNGNEYAIVWFGLNRQGGSGVYFTRVSRDGVAIGEPRLIAATAGWPKPSLVWAGDSYGVAWSGQDDNENRDIYFARLDPEGVRIGPEVRVSQVLEGSFEPSLVWTGSDFGVTWYDLRDGNREVYYARLSAEGARITPNVRATEDPRRSTAPKIAWNGDEHAIIWVDDRSLDEEVYFMRGDLVCR